MAHTIDAASSRGSDATPERVEIPLDLKVLRHPTESSRFALAMVSTAAGTAFTIFALLVVTSTAELVAPVLVILGTLTALWVGIQFWKIRLLADAVKVDAATLPELNDVVEDVKQRLDYRRRIDVFVVDKLVRVVPSETRTATVTTFFGTRVILLEGSLVGDLSTEETRERCTFLVATLIGALKARYAQWGAVLNVLRTLKMTVIVAPLVTPWLRATVYTGDRLAYACCGDLDVSIRAAYRSLVGGDLAPHLRSQGLVNQALAVRRNRVLQIAQLLRATPHVPNRYLELLAFAEAHQPVSYVFYRADVVDHTGQLDKIVTHRRGRVDRGRLVPVAIVVSAGLLAASIVGGVIGKSPAKDWLSSYVDSTGLAATSSGGGDDLTFTSDNAQTQALMAAVPESIQDSCSSFELSTDGGGAQPGVSCAPGDDIDGVFFTTYDKPNALRQMFALVSGSPPFGDCANGSPSTQFWRDQSGTPGGAVACFVDDKGKAELVWTMTEFNVLGNATASNDDIAGLYDWWDDLY